MFRAAVGAMSGVAVGLLLAAGCGAVFGYRDGLPGRRDLAPGFEAALTSGFVWVVFFGWMPATIGGVIGGLAGLGSALVAPAGVRRAARDRPLSGEA